MASLTAYQSILVAWVALGLVLTGIGALVHRVAGARLERGDDWLLSFWLGWVVAVFALQVWHLFQPVGWRVVALLVAVGVLGLGTAGLAAWAVVLRGLRRHALAVVVAAVLAAWVAERCLGGPQNGDSGFYHIPTVRWFLAYPIVPGLANLFAALAYNQSYFLYVAMLDLGPFAHESHHLANGVLVAALFARIALGASHLVRLGWACPPRELFWALLLPAAVGLAFDINLTSPSPDIAVFSLALVLSGQVLALATRAVPRALDVVAIGLLAAAGVTVKLSLGGFAAVGVPVAALLWLRRARPTLARAAACLGAVGLAVAAGVVPWMIRGVYLSGYPLYPATLGGVTAEWSAPLESVIAEANLIRYWNGVQDWWLVVFRDPRWFVRWLDTLGWYQREVMLPLGIAAVMGMLGLVRWLVQRRDTGRSVPAAIMLPTLGGLAFCFAAAPRARYGGAGFWLLAVQATVLALDGAPLAARRWLRVLPALAAVLLAAVPFTDGRQVLRRINYLETYPRPQLHEMQLATGLVIQVPGETMCCWDGPFPCTPYPNQALRLRRDGDLAAGFMIDPVVAAQARAGS